VSSSPRLLDSRLVTKRFDTTTVLQGVTLAVDPGEIVGFVGPNGAGKTTWLRCVVGITHRSSGSIRVLGLDPEEQPVAVRARTSYLPGETSVYENMRGVDFVNFALHFYPNRQTDIIERLTEGFALPMKRKVRNYSAGMKQKLALVAALGPDVPLYLLDEPDRALDASTRLFLRDVLLALRERGKGVLLSSHHLGEVKLLADRTEFLVGGRIVPGSIIAEDEANLRHRIWLRLTDGTPTPAGCTELRREPDGTMLVEVPGEPVAWLQQIPADQIQAAEVGLTRLEDLYRELADHPGLATSEQTGAARGAVHAEKLSGQGAR